MTEWEAIKRPKLDATAEVDTSAISSGFMPLPFSRYLSNSFQHNQKHPILSDSKLVVYDLKGMHCHPHCSMPPCDSPLARISGQTRIACRLRRDSLESIEGCYSRHSKKRANLRELGSAVPGKSAPTNAMYVRSAKRFVIAL